MSSNDTNPTAEKKSSITLSSEVARCVELSTVAFRSCSAQFLGDESGPPGPLSKEMAVGAPQYKVSWKCDSAKNVFDVLVRMMVSAKDRSDGERERVKITCDLALRYSCAAEASATFSEDHYRAFSEINALVNAFPYFREYVQSSTCRMGLEPLVLPLFKVSKPKALPAPAAPASTPER